MAWVFGASLNGWRRLALTLSVLWMLAACGMAVTSYLGKEPGAFVTVWEGDPKFDLSTAKPVVTREEIYQAIRNADKANDGEAVRALGEYLKAMPVGGASSAPPVDYAALAKAFGGTSGPAPVNFVVVAEIRRLRLLLGGFVAPLGLWLFAELLAAVVRWIGQGFKKPEPFIPNK